MTTDGLSSGGSGSWKNSPPRATVWHLPDATMFLYVQNPSSYADDFVFVEELAAAGLLVLPAPVFHHRGYFRLSLTGSEPMLEQALSILRRFAP